MLRAIASVLPPGDDGEMISTAFEGLHNVFCAHAAPAIASTIAPQKNRPGGPLNLCHKFTIHLWQQAAVAVGGKLFIGVDAGDDRHINRFAAGAVHA